MNFKWFRGGLGFEFSLDKVYAYFLNLLEFLASSKVKTKFSDSPCSLPWVSKLGPNDTLGGFWGANSHLN